MRITDDGLTLALGQHALLPVLHDNEVT